MRYILFSSFLKRREWLSSQDTPKGYQRVFFLYEKKPGSIWKRVRPGMDTFSFSLVTRNLCSLPAIPKSIKSLKRGLPLASARYSLTSPQASVLQWGHFHLWSRVDSHSHLHLWHFTLITECCVYVCFLFIPLYKYSLSLYYYYT